MGCQLGKPAGQVSGAFQNLNILENKGSVIN